jgi:putative flippase GtrA
VSCIYTTRRIAQINSSIARPEHALEQFIRFGLVGAVGFALDTAAVYFLRRWTGLYSAGILAYGIAATGTWLLNRIWTFRGRGTGTMPRQWARYMIANLGGFALNRGTYALLVTFLAAAVVHPVIATAAGSLAGMLINFRLSRRVVFR